MSSDGGDEVAARDTGATGARRAYNRPRRYPVRTPAPPSSEVTRRHPTYADAAQEWQSRQAGASPAAYAHPSPTNPIAPGGPAPAPRHTPRRHTPSRHTPSARVLLVAAGVVVVLAVVIGVVVGLSHDGSGTQAGGPAGPSSSVPAGGEAPPATAVCTDLGNTSPVSSFVARPRPAERMPVSYVEPDAGTKVAVCVGLLRPGAGAGRGRVGYLAEYARLPATQYATSLKTLGWTFVATLPRTTYRSSLGTTVTLVQQGTALVTVVGVSG